MKNNIEEKIEELMYGDEYGGLTEIVRLGKDAIPTLVSILQKHQEGLMRKRAAIALGRIKDTLAINPLIESLQDKDPTVVISVIDALSKFKDKKLSKNITPLIQSEDPSLRRYAVKALGNLGDENSKKMLEELITKENQEFVIKEISKTLKKLENQD
ncbi:MAG: HEAT repeat domain-containing protein [Promethearchaeota archaeon]